MQLSVLVSGSGTLLEAMLAAEVPISLVLADRNCRGVDVATKASVPAVVLERHDFGESFEREAYAEKVASTLDEYSTDLVAMAGFGTILGAPMFDRYAGRILNTHPALLPAFPGWHAVRDALAYGVKVSGCTIHIATPIVDDGPILAQEAVPVLPDDDEASLHERIKVVERRLYIETIHAVLSGTIDIGTSTELDTGE